MTMWHNIATSPVRMSHRCCVRIEMGKLGILFWAVSSGLSLHKKARQGQGLCSHKEQRERATERQREKGTKKERAKVQLHIVDSLRPVRAQFGARARPTHKITPSACHLSRSAEGILGGKNTYFLWKIFFFEVAFLIVFC